MDIRTRSDQSIDLLRADAVRSLSALFIFPGGELSQLREDIDFLTSTLAQLDQGAMAYAEELSSSLLELDIHQLRLEFTRLFLGPFRTIAPPYGSCYLEDGQLMGESTIAVMNAYVDAGLTLHKRFKDLPDHISAELEFMYYLLMNRVRLVENGNLSEAEEIERLYVEFLHGLVLPWLPLFCERISQNTHLEYFRLLAELVRSFPVALHLHHNTA